jgi:hypothetical protein
LFAAEAPSELRLEKAQIVTATIKSIFVMIHRRYKVV